MVNKPHVLSTLVEAGIRHVVICIQAEDCDQNIIYQVHEKLIALRKITATLACTIKFECVPSSVQFSQLLTIICPVQLCIIPYKINKESTVKTFASLINSLNSEMLTKFALSNIPSDDFQWVIENARAASPHLVMYHFPQFSMPNFQMRQVDMAHSRTVNVMYSMPSMENIMEQFAKVDYMDRLIESYDKHPITIVTKFLLQIGAVIIFPITIPDDIMLQHVAPLCHPFSNRRTFFSSIAIKRFMLTDEHVEEMVLASEAVELKQDEYWKQHAESSAPPRQLFEIPCEERI